LWAGVSGQSSASARRAQAASVWPSRFAQMPWWNRLTCGIRGGEGAQVRQLRAQGLVVAGPRGGVVVRRPPPRLVDLQPLQGSQQPLGLARVGLGDEHVAAGPQPHRMRALDGQAGLGEGARPVDLAVVLGADAVEGNPHRGGPQRRGGREHLRPVLTGGQRHAGGGQRLELGRADVVGEQPQDLRGLGVGGDLVHRVGAEAQLVLVAKDVRLLEPRERGRRAAIHHAAPVEPGSRSVDLKPQRVRDRRPR
jgi:hypothetical protein